MHLAIEDESGDDMPLTAALQEEWAKSGEAVGQCQHCGSFRADGRPPFLHRSECQALHPVLAALDPDVRKVVDDTAENWRRDHGE